MRCLPKLKIPREVLLTAAIFWLLMLLFIIHRHYSLYPSFSSHDQGILNQVFWNGSHGNWFQSSLSSGESTAVWLDGNIPDVSYLRLGQHFTPIHFLWLPLYILFPYSATLLVLQVTLITLAGLALHQLACQRLHTQIAIWITLSYYCATAVIGPNLANFHDFSQIPLFVFLSLVALEKERWWWFWGIVLIILMIREDTGIVLFSIGFYLFLSRRHWLVGIGLCTVSAGYLLVVTNLIMPLFSDEVGRHFLVDSYGSYVDESQPSTISLIVGFLTHPKQLLIDLIAPVPATLRYLSGHFLPLMFVPAISLASWANVAFPLLALLLRQDTYVALSMQLRYAVMLVPGLFYGSILWWSAHPGTLKLATKRIWAGCLGLSLFFTFTLNPVRVWSFLIPDSIDPWVYVSPFKQWQHVHNVRTLLSQIPAEASVSASDHLLPHLSSRRAINRFPILKFRNDEGQESWVDYIIVDLWQLEQYQAAFRQDRERLRNWTSLINQLVEDSQYSLLDYSQGVVLMAPNSEPNPKVIIDWTTFYQAVKANLKEDN